MSDVPAPAPHPYGIGCLDTMRTLGLTMTATEVNEMRKRRLRAKYSIASIAPYTNHPVFPDKIVPITAEVEVSEIWSNLTWNSK